MSFNGEPAICVIDDDEATREGMVSLFECQGLRAQSFGSAEEFLAAPPAERPACLVLDVGLPGLDGLALQNRLAAGDERVPIIFVTGRADVPMSVRAIKAGAVDFLTKPFDPDVLIQAIMSVIERESEVATTAGSRSPAQLLDGIVGTSEVLGRVLRDVRTVAATNATVLIHGETGTGKERIARAVHDLSARRSGSFVKVNCAAIPTGLLESELLGHERGAFTGALTQRIGRFESAHEGTIFLDEIGEMPLELQPKLLRVLQERELERVGGSKTLRVDVRVVAATNRDLRQMVAAGTFREDLYYRLSVFPVELPPLRERRNDIPELARHFADDVAARMGRAPLHISAKVVERLASYNWPGNIRELQNVIERAVILATGPELVLHSELASPASPAASQGPKMPDSLTEASRAHILRVLDETNWVVGGRDGAAARLAMKRTTLHFRMKKLGIVRPAGIASALRDGFR